ncbi:DUF4864 domain-containing protein [Lichenibacterium dinghuense]|uniref:DUF4864 domain-containing protein n=1 Tax=Lichenibacterium dinghuense TaxID=2895977 RepID=UPI001F35EF1E|nr:DUF4864 domain-containing protein [Lichenibacterium sp. 6Y81]
MRHRLAPALLAAALLASTASSRAAEAGADPDIQSTITAQIDAFGEGDAARAESFASPGIKSMFPDASAFYGMVKQSYGALVHPRSTYFEPTVTAEGGAVQHVTVVDSDGVVWTAVYSLEKVDGRWAISGCVLVKSKETTA